MIKPISNLINNHYCCYLLKADLKKLVKVSSGTAVPNLLLGDLKKHVVNIPKSLIEQINMDTGKEGAISTFPSPDQLWDMVFPKSPDTELVEVWRDKFDSIPFEDIGGTRPLRRHDHGRGAEETGASRRSCLARSVRDGSDRRRARSPAGT